MKVFILLSLILVRFFASSELFSIKTSYQKVLKDFKIQKSENNITKLLEISRILYDNNKKLKKLKVKYTKKLSLELKSEKEFDKLQMNDIVELYATTSHNINKEYKKSNLSFYIYDKDELLLKKDVELYEKGGVHKEKLKFKITKPSDEYRICAIFQEDEKEYKECKSLKVACLLKVKDIVVSTYKNATVMDDNIYAGEDVYIISGFRLKNLNDIVNIDVRLVDVTKDKLLVETTFKRPKKGNTEKEQPLRFRISASKLYGGQKLAFGMRIYSDKINPVLKKIDIPIKSYKILVSTPSSLVSGDSGRYKITVPKKFIAPLQVDIEPSGGIVIAWETKLSGTVSAINTRDEKAYLDIKVKDANGKIATTLKSIKLVKKESIQSAECYYPNESYLMLYGNSSSKMVTSIYPKKENVYHSTGYKMDKIKTCGCEFYVKNNTVKQEEVGRIDKIAIYKLAIGFTKSIKSCSDFQMLQKGIY